MTIKFQDLPKHEKVYIILKLGLPPKEEQLLYLRYVEMFSYSRIAAELNISPKSVGPMLTRVRKHSVKIAYECFDIADERCKAIIKKVDWSDSPNRVRNGLAEKASVTC